MRDKIDLILIWFGICIIIYILTLIFAGDKICGWIKEWIVYNIWLQWKPNEARQMWFCHDFPWCELMFYGSKDWVKDWKCETNIY